MLEFRESKCMFCGGCAAVCPEMVITVFSAHLEFDRDKCTSCGNCVKVCPAAALRLR